MDLEILFICITVIVCGFFLALIRLVLRCAEETEVMDYIGMAQVVEENLETKEEIL